MPFDFLERVEFLGAGDRYRDRAMRRAVLVPLFGTFRVGDRRGTSGRFRTKTAPARHRDDSGA